MREDGDPTYELAMGAFDQPNALPHLEHQTGVESRVDWILGLDQLETQETTDDRTPEDMLRLKSLQHPDHDTTRWPPEGDR